MHKRTVLTCLGPDHASVRPLHRGGMLFDMGLGQIQVDFCIRTEDETLIAMLLCHEGQSLFAPENPAMAAILRAHPHRIALTRLGRVDIYQKIGGPDTGGTSPQGPHTHVLPKLLASGRSHSANVPIPEGLIPCAGYQPPSPISDAMGAEIAFDAARFAAFETLLRAWGHGALSTSKTGCARLWQRGPRPKRSWRPRRGPSGSLCGLLCDTARAPVAEAGEG